MRIARIVSSNSHIDYVCRVIDPLDSADPPAPDDYGFGHFVAVDLPGGGRAVGVIYNSVLVNPDYSNYGPRLSPRHDLTSFSPDFLNEQGILLGVLMLGFVSAEGAVSHGVPRRVVPAGQDVRTLDGPEIAAFHSEGGELRIHYFSQIVTHAGQFSVPLLESIIERLGPACADADRKRLQVLRRTLLWQRTVGGIRL